MILRLYRLSDKLGVFIIKMGVALADWLVDGASLIVSTSKRGTGGFFAGIVSVLLLVTGFLWKIIKGIGNGLGSIARFVVRIIRRLFPQMAKAREAAVNRTTDVMARRAAQDEIDVIIKEDPLKVQNRRLSFMVLILAVAVVAAILWATDPSRTQSALPIAPVANITNPENAIPQSTAVAGVNTAPTQIPTATALPEPLQARGAIAYTVRENGQTDIQAVNVGSRTSIRITNNMADERDPEWNSDGTRLAYAARIDGNWDLYIYDAFQDATGRVTVDSSFQANPSWSPDGRWLAYENYQNDNLDIFALPIDASESPTAITIHPAPDFSPAWSPDGRSIAFVSWRDGNQDIYVISLDDSSNIINVTNTPNINEDYPTWSPDGRSIAYSALEPGANSENIFLQSMDDLGSAPQLIAIGRSPSFAPDGSSITFAVDTRDGSRTDIFAVTVGEGGLPILIASVPRGSTAPTWTLQPLPATLVNSGGLPPAVTDALYIEQTDTFDGSQFQLRSLGNVQIGSEQVLLSDAVNDSYNALRQAVLEGTNLDYLGALDNAFWRLERPADFGEPGRNWHRTGRAFAIRRSGIQGLPRPIELVQEVIGNQVYWRIFVRVDEDTQRGQLGEPLRDMPWDFLAATQADVDAYNEGGRLRREVPAGYYIDFTILADDYGWERVSAGNDWVANERARNYWLFINDDDLTWCQGMLQLYTEGLLENYECRG